MWHEQRTARGIETPDTFQPASRKQKGSSDTDEDAGRQRKEDGDQRYAESAFVHTLPRCKNRVSGVNVSPWTVMENATTT